MIYFDTAGRITLLIGVCIPFCILVFSMWFKNAEALPKLLGLAFWAPLLLNAAAFLAIGADVSRSFAAASVLLLLLTLSFLFIIRNVIIRNARKHINLIQSVLWIFPVLVLALINYSAAVRDFLQVNLNTLPLLIVLALLNMYLLKKEKDSTGLFFWAMLPAAAAGLAGPLLGEDASRYIVPVFELSAYILFAIYFHRVYLRDILIKISEADRKMSIASRSIDYEVKKRVMEIEKVNQNLVNISKIDPLTKTLNKAAILDFMENLILTRPKSVFSVAMFDIDNFKTINDTLGHVAGDKCIRTLAALAKSNLREFDVIGRYGGDEFVIVLPGANTAQALIIAERFRKKTEATEAPHFTISIGIATYPEDGETVKQLIEAADDYMYKSKGRGKNAVSHRSSY